MDDAIVIWLNGWVGRSVLLDKLMEAVVSDYLVPVFGSLVLLGLWFSGGGNGERLTNQLTTITGTIAVGFANGLVTLVNAQVFRARPFADLDLNLAFYEPTDSSFPANAAGVGFALATAVFLRHRRLGVALYLLAALWGLARVYVGVHYASDVLAGAAIGVVAALLAAGLVRAAAPALRSVLRAFQSLYVT